MTWRVALFLGATGFALAATLAMAIRDHVGVHAQTEERPRLSVRPADDFEVTGTGEHAGWERAEWVTLRRRQPEGHPYESRFKILYSGTGLYFLMEGTDRTLTATMSQQVGITMGIPIMSTIATGRIHARGPVGLEQLTTYRYLVLGTGQVRP